jgi:hypothetical protein
MKRINCLLYTLIGLTLMSCNDESPKGVVLGYEEVAGFSDHPSISTEQYHSGSVSVKVNQDIPYGLTYKRKLRFIHSGQASRINISAWVRSDSDLASGKLICAIDSGSTNLFWNAIETKDIQLKPGAWSEMKVQFDISGKYNPEHTLVVYGMSTGQGNVWFDDINFTLE